MDLRSGPAVLRVGSRLLRRLVEHSGRCAPNEACGILLGTINGGAYTASDIIFVENTAKSPVRFAMDDADVLGAYQAAERDNLDIAGIYHSHPSSPAEPSETDQTYMRINPTVWLISSGLDGSFRAWHMEGRVREIPLTVT